MHLRTPWSIAASGVAFGLALVLLSCAARVRADEERDPDADRLAEVRVLMDDGRFAEAIPRLEAMLAETPHWIDAWERLAWAHFLGGETDRARDVLDTWAELEPHRPEVHETIARIALSEDRLDDAIAGFREALRRAPGREDLRFLLARTLRWGGHLAEAADRLRSLHARFPEDVEIRLALARTLNSNWEYEEALGHWTALLAMAPRDTERRIGEAQAALHSGRVRSAILSAHRLIEEDPDRVEAWRLLADAHEHDGRTEEAIPALEAWLERADDPEDRRTLLARLLALRLRLHEAAPGPDTWDQAMAIAARAAEAFPEYMDARLTHGEMKLRAGRWAEAEEVFLAVLREFNPRNLRALRGLFEAALVQRRFDEAWDWLDRIRAFNPGDPYLALEEARWHAARGSMTRAYATLDRLAEAGERGAAAVLLYHALTESPYGPALAAERFRDHLRALLEAGYEVITPDELHARWDRHGPHAGRHPDGRIRREVMVTFDDALESTMRFGTPIALDYGVRLVQHIPVGNVIRGDPFICSWEQLRAYAETGAWVYGSHLLFAHDPSRMSRDGAFALPMATPVWIEGQARMETRTEYFARLRHEYERSQKLIAEHLGHPARFAAYPYGDIGQENVSKVSEAVPVNLQHAGAFYDIGFIQSPHAHAVRGDHPLLYARHEMDIAADGDATVRYLLERHPFFLAERTRAAMALVHGHPGVARLAIERLRRGGYPEAELSHLEGGLRARVARHFAGPALIADPDRMVPAPPEIHVGATVHTREDSFRARSTRGLAHAEIRGAHPAALRLSAGWGELRQPGGPSDRATHIGEMTANLGLAWTGPDRTGMEVEGGWRAWSGIDADGVARAMAAVYGRVTPELELRLRIDRDGVENAAALARGLTRVRTSLDGVWDLAPGWQIAGSGAFEYYSDGNRLDRASLTPMAVGRDGNGWRFGARFDTLAARRDTPDLWTPRSLHAGYLLAGYRARGTYGLAEIMAQLGAARERGHPVTEDGTPPPDRGYRPATGLTAWWAWVDRAAWGGGIEAAYHESPGYREFRGALRGTYRFR